MPVDGKYGYVTTERGSIGYSEPVVVFRAQDQLLVKVLSYYLLLCAEAGSPEKHLKLIDLTIRNVAEWQAGNFTKVPSSDSYAEESE